MSTRDPGPGRVRVRVYADLQWFTDAAEQHVPVGAPRSVKDLVESVGVPHPEIGLVVCDGEVVGFDHRVTAGDRVAVYPPPRSLDLESPTRRDPPAPRFVLDVHLGTLARRLGVLGLDADYATDRDDVELARIADEEDRVLLTRDRRLLMRSRVRYGFCPRSDDPDTQVLEVVERFVSADDLAPFSRCPVCNDRLAVVATADVFDDIGQHTRATHDAFRRCPTCGRVFWPGTHVEQLTALVERVREVVAGT